MTKDYAKCGCDCFNCPTYKENIRTIEDRQRCSSGWEKYLDIKLSPEKLRPCDGCSISDSGRKTYYLNCIVRKCAIVNEIDNCAFCTGFPCLELLNVHSLQKINNRQEFTDKTGKEISDGDFSSVIEPYAGFRHLKQIRHSLTDGDLKDYKKHSSSFRFARIENLSNKPRNIQTIYSLLTHICMEQDISFARLQTIKKRREQLTRILWTVGCYGSFIDENTLELDSSTFMSQKINGSYDTLTDYLRELEKHDIYCEIIPFLEKGWLTPKGGLRKDGWIFRCKFGDSFAGSDMQKVFKNYVQKLDALHGNKAYRAFNRADISIMDD